MSTLPHDKGTSEIGLQPNEGEGSESIDTIIFVVVIIVGGCTRVQRKDRILGFL
jgi:hypothetical protein